LWKKKLSLKDKISFLIGNFEVECDQVEHEFSKAQCERFGVALMSHFKSDLGIH